MAWYDKDVEESIRQSFKKTATLRRIDRGTVLLYQGEVPQHAFIVQRGLMRAYTISPSGEERITNLYGVGDIIPIAWIFGESSLALFYYEAVSDSTLLQVDRQKFVGIIDGDPELTRAMLRYSVRETTAQMIRITALEQSTAAEKIALTLYYLLIRHGQQVRPGLYVIKIRLTQAMIANLVGLTRESTAINLKTLRQEKIISYGNFTYTIDKAALERFVGEDSFKDLTL